MKHGWKASWFVAGALTAVLTMNLLSPALAALPSQWIEVFTGVNIYIDDVKLDPRDANGNPVEVFVYNGTTYLPVRAVGEAVGKTVQWEGKTSSVYLGKHSSDKPAVLLQDLDYFKGTGWVTKGTVKDNLGQVRTNAFEGASDNGNGNATYKLNGQYTMLSGTFFQPYNNRSDGVSDNTTLEIYADDALIYSAEMMGGIEPINFTLDMTGVLELRVRLTSFDGWGHGAAMISDCGLWT